MRRALATVAVLGLVVLFASPAAALACLNSKPCGSRCIAWNKVCHLRKCPPGAYLCNNSYCVPNGILCRVN
jgi:hypothetical protein